jgi:hypothetical protein
MSKGQQRSNREAKKPKSTTKKKPAPAPSVFSTPPVSKQKGK